MRLVPAIVLCVGIAAGAILVLWNPSLVKDSRRLKHVSEVVFQMPHVYMASLETHPLRTKCVTGLILFATADATAQLLTAVSALRVRRVASFAIWGAAVGAPLFHLWYTFLAKAFRDQLSYSIWFGAILMSVCDQLLFMPVFVSLYYLYNALTTGGTYVEAYVKLRRELWYLLQRSWLFWIPANTLNFAMIPPSLQVTVVCMLSVLWNTYFSMATAALSAAMPKENETDSDAEVLIDSHQYVDESMAEDSTQRKV